MESADLRVRTLKVGLIARAAAVFRVDRIVVYKDEEFDDSRFISLVLRYAETPQYLRKMLFPRRRELSQVGVLPPLRTNHHPVNSDSSTLKLGELRVGVVVESVGSDDSAWVEIGVDRPVPLKTEKDFLVGQRLNVRIFSQKPLAAEPVDRRDIPCYWGYETISVDSAERYLQGLGHYVVATSRKGRPVTPQILQEIERSSQKGLAVIFGSPARGVDAFLSPDMLDRCCMINTIPHQGTQTVRVEEAVYATLALLNMVRLEA
jgi:predicted SPOUT superfamily RNA methylase MTH1